MDTTERKPYVLIQRPMTMEDFRQLTESVNVWVEGNETPLFKYRKSLTDLAYILFTMFKQGQLRVYAPANDPMIPAGLLSVSIGQLWWIDARVLFEELVLNLDPKKFHGFLSFAIHEMEQTAKAYACDIICSGASMLQNTDKVEKKYKQHGFVFYGKDFLKEMD